MDSTRFVSEKPNKLFQIGSFNVQHHSEEDHSDEFFGVITDCHMRVSQVDDGKLSRPLPETWSRFCATLVGPFR